MALRSVMGSVLGSGLRGVIAGAGAGGAPPFSVTGLPLWSAGVQAAQAGTRNATILCVGDSTTAGSGANGSGYASNARANSWPTQLAALLETDIGLKSSWQSNTGFQNSAGAFTTYDSRLALPSGSWSVSGIPTVGGEYIRCTSASGLLTFLPTVQCDTFRVRYARFSGGGGFTLNFNGGSTLATVSTNNATQDTQEVTVTSSLGANTLNINITSANVYIQEIVGWNSAAKEITVINAGYGGSRVSTWLGNATQLAPRPVLGKYTPDLIYCELTINDWAVGTDLTTYESNLNTLVDVLQATGADVLLGVGCGSNTASVSQATQDNYRDKVIAVASAQGLLAPVNMTTILLGGYAAANTAGHMRDDFHPKSSGYAIMAAGIRDAITPA